MWSTGRFDAQRFQVHHNVDQQKAVQRSMPGLPLAQGVVGLELLVGTAT